MVIFQPSPQRELGRQNIWNLRKRFRLSKRDIDRQHAAIAGGIDVYAPILKDD
jgi:hypothetical protein